MPRFTVYARAYGTFFAEVEAESFEEALANAIDFELSDAPEVGECVEVLNQSTDETRVVVDGVLAEE